MPSSATPTLNPIAPLPLRALRGVSQQIMRSPTSTATPMGDVSSATAHLGGLGARPPSHAPSRGGDFNAHPFPPPPPTAAAEAGAEGAYRRASHDSSPQQSPPSLVFRDPMAGLYPFRSEMSGGGAPTATRVGGTSSSNARGVAVTPASSFVRGGSEGRPAAGMVTPPTTPRRQTISSGLSPCNNGQDDRAMMAHLHHIDSSTPVRQQQQYLYSRPPSVPLGQQAAAVSARNSHHSHGGNLNVGGGTSPLQLRSPQQQYRQHSNSSSHHFNVLMSTPPRVSSSAQDVHHTHQTHRVGGAGMMMMNSTPTSSPFAVKTNSFYAPTTASSANRSPMAPQKYGLSSAAYHPPNSPLVHPHQHTSALLRTPIVRGVDSRVHSDEDNTNGFAGPSIGGVTSRGVSPIVALPSQSFLLPNDGSNHGSPFSSQHLPPSLRQIRSLNVYNHQQQQPVPIVEPVRVLSGAGIDTTTSSNQPIAWSSSCGMVIAIQDKVCLLLNPTAPAAGSGGEMSGGSGRRRLIELFSLSSMQAAMPSFSSSTVASITAVAATRSPQHNSVGSYAGGGGALGHVTGSGSAVNVPLPLPPPIQLETADHALATVPLSFGRSTSEAALEAGRKVAEEGSLPTVSMSRSTPLPSPSIVRPASAAAFFSRIPSPQKLIQPSVAPALPISTGGGYHVVRAGDTTAAGTHNAHRPLRRVGTIHSDFVAVGLSNGVVHVYECHRRLYDLAACSPASPPYHPFSVQVDTSCGGAIRAGAVTAMTIVEADHGRAAGQRGRARGSKAKTRSAVLYVGTAGGFVLAFRLSRGTQKRADPPLVAATGPSHLAVPITLPLIFPPKVTALWRKKVVAMAEERRRAQLRSSLVVRDIEAVVAAAEAEESGVGRVHSSPDSSLRHNQNRTRPTSSPVASASSIVVYSLQSTARAAFEPAPLLKTTAPHTFPTSMSVGSGEAMATLKTSKPFASHQLPLDSPFNLNSDPINSDPMALHSSARREQIINGEDTSAPLMPHCRLNFDLEEPLQAFVLHCATKDVKRRHAQGDSSVEEEAIVAAGETLATPTSAISANNGGGFCFTTYSARGTHVVMPEGGGGRGGGEDSSASACNSNARDVDGRDSLNACHNEAHDVATRSSSMLFGSAAAELGTLSASRNAFTTPPLTRRTSSIGMRAPANNPTAAAVGSNPPPFATHNSPLSSSVVSFNAPPPLPPLPSSAAEWASPPMLSQTSPAKPSMQPSILRSSPASAILQKGGATPPSSPQGAAHSATALTASSRLTTTTTSTTVVVPRRIISGLQFASPPPLQPTVVSSATSTTVPSVAGGVSSNTPAKAAQTPLAVGAAQFGSPVRSQSTASSWASASGRKKASARDDDELSNFNKSVPCGHREQIGEGSDAEGEGEGGATSESAMATTMDGAMRGGREVTREYYAPTDGGDEPQPVEVATQCESPPLSRAVSRSPPASPPSPECCAVAHSPASAAASSPAHSPPRPFAPPPPLSPPRSVFAGPPPLTGAAHAGHAAAPTVNTNTGSSTPTGAALVAGFTSTGHGQPWNTSQRGGSVGSSVGGTAVLLSPPPALPPPSPALFSANGELSAGRIDPTTVTGRGAHHQTASPSHAQQSTTTQTTPILKLCVSRDGQHLAVATQDALIMFGNLASVCQSAISILPPDASEGEESDEDVGSEAEELTKNVGSGAQHTAAAIATPTKGVGRREDHRGDSTYVSHQTYASTSERLAAIAEHLSSREIRGPIPFALNPAVGGNGVADEAEMLRVAACRSFAWCGGDARSVSPNSHAPLSQTLSHSAATMIALASGNHGSEVVVHRVNSTACASDGFDSARSVVARLETGCQILSIATVPASFATVHHHNPNRDLQEDATTAAVGESISADLIVSLGAPITGNAAEATLAAGARATSVGFAHRLVVYRICPISHHHAPLPPAVLGDEGNAPCPLPLHLRPVSVLDCISQDAVHTHISMCPALSSSGVATVAALAGGSDSSLRLWEVTIPPSSAQSPPPLPMKSDTVGSLCMAEGVVPGQSFFPEDHSLR